MMPAADGNFSGSLRGLRLPNSLSERQGHHLRCSCLALYSDAWSIEKEYAQASKTGEQRGTVLSSRKAE